MTSVPGAGVPVVRLPFIDKLVHFGLYAVLGALLARALREAGRLHGRALALALAGAALFAAFDEWHQQFIPGRSADVRDWYADVVGASLVLLLVASRTARPEMPS